MKILSTPFCRCKTGAFHVALYHSFLLINRFNLLNIAFSKLQHIIPFLYIRGTERELRQTKIGEPWNTAGAAVSASLEAGCCAVRLHTVYLCYSSSSRATPARAARGALGRAISSFGFQVGHVDLLVNPNGPRGELISPQRGVGDMKRGMLVVSLRGINSVFWSYFGGGGGVQEKRQHF